MKQGDPLSPFLFNLAADTLAKMIHVAQNNGMVSGLVAGLVPHLKQNGMAILKYADDTFLLMDDDKNKAVNTKLLLYSYEAMSSLKINFQKSEVLVIGGNDGDVVHFANMFNCQTGGMTFEILRGTCELFQVKLEERLMKRLDGLKGGSLSLGGKNVLINSSLSSIPIYHMSLYLLPKTVLNRMDIIRTFFW